MEAIEPFEGGNPIINALGHKVQLTPEESERLQQFKNRFADIDSMDCTTEECREWHTKVSEEAIYEWQDFRDYLVNKEEEENRLASLEKVPAGTWWKRFIPYQQKRKSYFGVGGLSPEEIEMIRSRVFGKVDEASGPVPSPDNVNDEKHQKIRDFVWDSYKRYKQIHRADSQPSSNNARNLESKIAGKSDQSSDPTPILDKVEDFLSSYATRYRQRYSHTEDKKPCNHLKNEQNWWPYRTVPNSDNVKVYTSEMVGKNNQYSGPIPSSDNVEDMEHQTVTGTTSQQPDAELFRSPHAWYAARSRWNHNLPKSASEALLETHEETDGLAATPAQVTESDDTSIKLMFCQSRKQLPVRVPQMSEPVMDFVANGPMDSTTTISSNTPAEISTGMIIFFVVYSIMFTALLFKAGKELIKPSEPKKASRKSKQTKIAGETADATGTTTEETNKAAPKKEDSSTVMFETTFFSKMSTRCDVWFRSMKDGLDWQFYYCCVWLEKRARKRVQDKDAIQKLIESKKAKIQSRMISYETFSEDLMVKQLQAALDFRNYIDTSANNLVREFDRLIDDLEAHLSEVDKRKESSTKQATIQKADDGSKNLGAMSDAEEKLAVESDLQKLDNFASRFQDHLRPFEAMSEFSTENLEECERNNTIIRAFSQAFSNRKGQVTERQQEMLSDVHRANLVLAINETDWVPIETLLKRWAGEAEEESDEEIEEEHEQVPEQEFLGEAQESGVGNHGEIMEELRYAVESMASMAEDLKVLPMLDVDVLKFFKSYAPRFSGIAPVLMKMTLVELRSELREQDQEENKKRIKEHRQQEFKKAFEAYQELIQSGKSSREIMEELRPQASCSCRQYEDAVETQDRVEGEAEDWIDVASES